MRDVPEGFRRISADGAALVLRDDVASALTAAGFADPAALAASAPRRYRGRGAPFALDVPGVGAVFVRPYLHGGLLGKVTADRFGGEQRFADEVATLARCAARGVPVPEVLGYVARGAGLGLRRGWLLTREAPGAQDLLRVLRDAAPVRRRAVLARAGRACRALHDAGVEHTDLHWKNLLVLRDDRVLVLDLDGARDTGAPLPRDVRLRGLFRCDRYADKQTRAGHPLTRTDRLRFLRAYAGADWPPRDELRRIAADLARHIGRHRSSLSAPAQERPATNGAAP